DSHGWTPLHWAASLGNEESANGLLNHGVNINASDANSWTPLTFAVVKGHFNVVKLLLSRGADRNTQDTLKLSPERWASICSHDDILQLLHLPRGTVGRLGRTCLHTAAYGTSPSIAAFLLQSGADGSIRDEMGRIPLHLAAAYGSLEVVQVMIEAPNVDVNARDEMGRTPIHWCCALGGWKQREKRSEENIKICRLLLSKGASLSAVDDNGHTALHYAIVLRDEEVIRLCLDHGLQL
ncbi:ankyrin repeat-containing domain protein, partial [Ilyonectria robusta]|uniref:ankyrin repeat-containing domain protein n=1 Tax=Ilyonectria robusta TaxID=1079257 RepID=UPI001E8D9C57